MANHKSWFNRLAFLVVSLAIVSGALYGYLSPETSPAFISPVVLGALSDSGRSPFAGLLALKPPSLTQVLPDLGKILGVTTTNTLPPAKAKKNLSPTLNLSGTSALSAPTPSPTSTAEAPSTSSSSSGSFPDSSTNATAGSATTAYTSSQQAVEDTTNLVVSYLKAGNYSGLYNLMSQDFKNTFSKDDFVGSFNGSGTVSSGQILAAPKVYGINNEWAEQSLSLNLASAGSQKYLNVYHFETGAWTLFGTEEQ